MKEFLEYQLRPVENNIKDLEKKIKQDTERLAEMQPQFLKQLAERVQELAGLKAKKEDLLYYIEFAEDQEK